jgi:Zn-dependent M28 family amino/carboxypeptidase
VKTLLIVLLLLVVVATIVVLAMKMPGRSFRGSPPPLDAGQRALREALRLDVVRLAGTIGERNVVLSKEYAQAADFIEQSLREAGYATARQMFVVEGVACVNVEAEVHGTGDGIVIVGAHYDTVDGSPGADDNGSGVAALLALARAFAHEHPRQTIRFVAFANEEPPYFRSEQMGSYIYAKRCHERGEKVTAMLILESLGFFRDEPGSQQYPAFLEHLYPSAANFIAFAGNLGSRSLVRRCIGVFRAHATIPSEGASLPEAVPGIGWSDQWSFWRFGYPAAMVSDTAPYRNPHYHTARDLPETLDYDRLARVVDGLRFVVAWAAGLGSLAG